MRTQERKVKDTKILDITKAVSLFIMIMYCFFNEFLLTYIGGALCIAAVTFMVIPRRYINHLLDTQEE